MDWIGVFLGHFGKFSQPSGHPLVYQFFPALRRPHNARRRCPPVGLMPLKGRGNKRTGRPLLRVFATLEPSLQYK
ncbi:hypothetical protein Holit_03087 [Hollandina sp. SP2]